LFAPETPEAARLDVTLARLKSVVSEDRVSATKLVDSHHPSAFAAMTLETDEVRAGCAQRAAHVALRRVRPPQRVDVILLNDKPAAVRDRDDHLAVNAAYGPWRTSGNWWCADAWDWEEWDVLAQDGAGESFGCLLVYDRLRKEWHMEALFD